MGLSINRLAGARGFAREFVERRGKADAAWTSLEVIVTYLSVTDG